MFPSPSFLTNLIEMTENREENREGLDNVNYSNYLPHSMQMYVSFLFPAPLVPDNEHNAKRLD